MEPQSIVEHFHHSRKFLVLFTDPSSTPNNHSSDLYHHRLKDLPV